MSQNLKTITPTPMKMTWNILKSNKIPYIFSIGKSNRVNCAFLFYIPSSSYKFTSHERYFELFVAFFCQKKTRKMDIFWFSDFPHKKKKSVLPQ